MFSASQRNMLGSCHLWIPYSCLESVLVSQFMSSINCSFFPSVLNQLTESRSRKQVREYVWLHVSYLESISGLTWRLLALYCSRSVSFPVCCNNVECRHTHKFISSRSQSLGHGLEMCTLKKQKCLDGPNKYSQAIITIMCQFSDF